MRDQTRSVFTKVLPSWGKKAIKRFLMRRSVSLSQAGQDLWVYGEVFDEKTHGFFLDIGAHDGIRISNTYLLEARYAWTGICIEANPATFSELCRNRTAKCLNVCLDRSEGRIDFVLDDVFGGIKDLRSSDPHQLAPRTVSLETVTLKRVLADANAPKIIDYLSIDVEGAEERILLDFPFTDYVFRCITIERPSRALRDLFLLRDYVLVKELPGLDCFYVHRSFLEEYMKNMYAFHGQRQVALCWMR